MPEDQATVGAAAVEPGENTAGAAAGLTEAEAARRRAQYGENALAEHHISALERLARFFWGPIPWMIEIAAVLSGVLRHWDDLAIILVMLFINAGVGFWQEFKADNAIALLKQRLALKARVKRDGTWKDIEARLLVPGDAVLVKLGNVVPADMKLIEGAYLSVDQSALTGESLPVDKKTGDEIYSGSIAKQGEMTGVVTATGMNTYFGKTAHLVEQAKTVSHFQRAVLRIGNFLILVTVGLVLMIGIAALYRRDPLMETVQFALILTIASIPVALPAVLSVTMAVGAERLAKLKAIVSRLVSIEEMAGMNMLCSDKTGTLTKNELTLGKLQPAPGVRSDDLLLAAVLASRRDAPDAIDAAILAGFPSDKNVDAYKMQAFKPFDPVAKRAEAEIEEGGKRFKVAKGAPQVIVDLCAPQPEERKAITAIVDEDAAKGFRTLGVARTDESGHWRFLGLLPLFDPPRDDCASTIATMHAMGVDIKMVTGDHEAIAKEIAGQVNLGQNIVVAETAFEKGDTDPDLSRIVAADGFARVFPEHKFKIVKVLQKAGHIVGMTGDGVNDAPALKQADVGIAVSGATDAARAAADLVLTAPGLSVITTAIEEARRIFERMNSYAMYRIAETIRLLLFMTASILIFNFYPVTAIMVVLLALLNDIPIMMIAYDNAPIAPQPVRWDMTRVLTIASVLGVYGVLESFIWFWVVRNYLGLSAPLVQALIFLKLLISGHMTIYLTRNKGPIWERPLPSWKLVVPSEATQLLGTFVVVYGWFMAPTGWPLALMVWAYTLVSFVVASTIKIGTYHLLEHRPVGQVKHLARVEQASTARPVPVPLRTFLLRGAAIATFALAAFGVASFIESEAPFRFVTEPASRGPIVRAVEAKGIINPQQFFFINPAVSGTIQNIFCGVDMQVKKAQVCAKIDVRPYQDAVDRSKADLALAQAQLARDEADLAHAKVNSERDLRAGRRRHISLRGARKPESASALTSPQIEFDKATIHEREASLRAAEDNLDATNIVSPADGTVISRNIAVGQMVAPSAEAPALFTIAGDLARLKIDAGVPESDIGGIKLGDKARFTVDTYPDRSFEAVVHRPPLVPRMVSDVVTYDVVLKVDNSNLLLKPGMIATVQIITASRSDVLKVPDQALQFLPSGVAAPPVLPAGQSRVWVLRDGKPTAVPLKLGLDDHHFSEVIEGDLKPGDKVVVGEDKPLSVINILKQHL
jgi:H+-transporting ATPase